ncbi:aldo-keto reductase family 1 member C21-like [Lepus europaeus]|uniref:aldo-keto reductase family 1 member C21-like n=1 Tax=Lepus europaeus TaxID=9983 RepID=UPI002B45A6D2|nr:aldo-keto reductase family 1 member C21-like [Lepus europaeus]
MDSDRGLDNVDKDNKESASQRDPQDSKAERNSKVFEFQLSSEDMETLDGLNKNLRYYPADIFIGHPNYPYSDEY